MPKLRLGLSLSSIKRIFADVVTDDGFRILTQSLDSIISQRGEFFLTQEADVSADFIETQDFGRLNKNYLGLNFQYACFLN